MGLLSVAVYLVLFSSFLVHGASKEMPPASLEVWPDSRQHFRGDQFCLHCSVNDGNSTGWMLRLQGTEEKSGCLQLNGTESIDRPKECHFIDINSKNSGLYWCESPAEDKRSNTINITVSYGEVILFSPVNPVMKGGTFTLECKSLLYKVSQTVFYKNCVNVLSLNGTKMTIENVTKADEGFYKCAFANSSLESSENWLRENSTVDSQDEKPSTGSLVWVSGICIIVILLVLLAVLWLIFPGLREKFNVCPNETSRVERFQQEMPKTKQDATEIQWDLPWMEMANLLDKQQHPCS